MGRPESQWEEWNWWAGPETLLHNQEVNQKALRPSGLPHELILVVEFVVMNLCSLRRCYGYCPYNPCPDAARFEQRSGLKESTAASDMLLFCFRGAVSAECDPSKHPCQRQGRGPRQAEQGGGAREAESSVGRSVQRLRPEEDGGGSLHCALQ